MIAVLLVAAIGFGVGRWTAMFLGLWGSYGKNDSVDLQYRLAGREMSATGLEILPPDQP